MIHYSRPKLSDLYTLFQRKLLENHTLTAADSCIAHIWSYPPGFAVSYFSVIAQKTVPWVLNTFHAQFPVTVILRSDFVWPKLCPPTPKSPASRARKRSQGSLPAILISNVSRWWSGYLAMGEGRPSPLPPLSRFGTLETKMTAP